MLVVCTGQIVNNMTSSDSKLSHLETTSGLSIYEIKTNGFAVYLCYSVPNSRLISPFSLFKLINPLFDAEKNC